MPWTLLIIGAGVSIAIIIYVIAITMYIKIKEKKHSHYDDEYLYDWNPNSDTRNSNSVSSITKRVYPYPMQSGAMNAAIGAVDKCCEFAAYCEKYVIPAGSCSPERLDGFIIATPRAISFGFNWKTFYYTLDEWIEKQGYSIHGGGFSFSDNSGMVSYERQIFNDETEYEAAYSWMMNTPVGEIIVQFEKVANNNFTSLGINSHIASCRCTSSDNNERTFEFTV